MDTVLTITLLIGIGVALLLARRIDDPIGRELDDMRGETELQACSLRCSRLARSRGRERLRGARSQ